MKSDIERLAKKYGLHYEHDCFSGITVVRESCWRIRSDLSRDGVVVHSLKEADQVLKEWHDQLSKQLSNEAVKALHQRISQKAQELSAEHDAHKSPP